MPGHLTGSAWVVSDGVGSPAVLLTHHRKLDRWLQLGGHSDGDADLPGVALREAREESGVAPFVPPGSDRWRLFDIDVHAIPARGDVPAHEHYDLRFLFFADREQPVTVSDESHDVAWISLQALEEYTDEPSMLRMRGKWMESF